MANVNESTNDGVVAACEVPSVRYLTSLPTKEELDNIFSINKNAIVVSGTAATGEPGPIVGRIDIAESEETYFFRVSLPGVTKKNFSCVVASDGKVLVKGTTVTGEEIVYRHSMKFVMQTQNLCPPGPFSVSFNLPGHVIPETLSTELSDGVLEGEIKKHISSNS